MPYDETLAQRVRPVLAPRPGVVEMKMFGGLAFMLNGNMAVGILNDRLMVRVGRDAYDDALAQPHCQPMDFTGRPMRGFVMVDPAGIADDSQLADWIRRGLDFASTLPAK